MERKTGKGLQDGENEGKEGKKGGKQELKEIVQITFYTKKL